MTSQVWSSRESRSQQTLTVQRDSGNTIHLDEPGGWIRDRHRINTDVTTAVPAVEEDAG